MDDFTNATKVRRFDSIYCPHCKKKVSKSTYYNHYSKFFNKASQSWQQESCERKSFFKEPDFDFQREESIFEAEAASVVGRCYYDALQVDDDSLDFQREEAITDQEAEALTLGERSDVLQTNDDYCESSSCLEYDHSNQQIQQWYDSESDEASSSLTENVDAPFPQCQNEDDVQSEAEIWESEDEDESDRVNDDIMDDTVPLKLVQLICVFLLSWQSNFRISDVAINALLKFLKMVLCNFMEIMKAGNLQEVSNNFPDTLQKARKMTHIDRDNFQMHIVCQQCHCTYPCDQLSRLTGTDNILKCSFVAFPRHPQKRMRSPCQFPLVKAVKTASGKKTFRPIKLFCYKSIIQSIGEMVQKPGMLDLLNHWKSRSIPNGVMADIYDGVVWKSFLAVNGEEFLQSRYGIGLLLSVDWFQPFKHVQYSVGAIYLVVLNLPRSFRYLRENMILAGIIPGPNEPSLHINSFLEQLVAELNKLWKGVEIETSEGKQKFFAAVICNSCDIPACRKIGGFVGHGATKGCSRCLKSFGSDSRTFGDKADYSGFTSESWPRRNADDHRRQGMDWKHARTLADRNKIEREHGVRYTELLRLPYFDTARFSVIDPLHNILLGTPKRMISIWKEKGYLSCVQLETIQARCDKFVVPSDVGRIPHKISSGFASFTADQWKNWTLIYSLITLKGILPTTDYNCWKLFVQACSLVCSKAINVDGVNQCDRFLITFCTCFQQLYGATLCTPNMHLHCHIKECLLDYGPGCSFWLFACERMNGFLGAVPTNHHSIEIQLMRRLCSTQQALHLLSVTDDSAFKCILDGFQASKGSLRYETLPDIPILTLSIANIETVNKFCKLLHPVKEACLSSAELVSVDSTLKAIFGPLHVRTLMLHKTSNAITFCNMLYGSCNNVHNNSSLVYAKFDPNSTIPAFVRNYVTVTAMLQVESNTKLVEVTLASVNWLLPHQHKDWFGVPVEVWRVYNPCRYSDAYIPVTNLLCRCAHITEKVTFGTIEDTVTIVVPINNFAGL